MNQPPIRSSAGSPFAFSYAEFLDWYRTMTAHVFEPARVTFERLLDQHLRAELTEFDGQRIKLSRGRVKNPARVWAKLQSSRYATAVSQLEDITTVLDDIVGLRIVCNNLCDVEYVQTILEEFPEWQDGDPGSISREIDSDRRYIEEPKPSGYRAYHLNLVTVVPQLHGVEHVRAELQVRTLLQDGWGELTHEDTYKPGMTLPPLVVRLSRRMADLLSSVDDLAQDLRDELDRLAQESLEPPIHATSQITEADSLNGAQVETALDEALEAETRVLVESLRRPAALAEIAQRLQAAFGTDVTQGWGGHGTFKALLLHAVPGVRLSSDSGYILPAGFDGVLSLHPHDGGGVPDVVRQLRRKDRHAPALSIGRMADLLRALDVMLDVNTFRYLEIDPAQRLDMQAMNKLTRYARDTIRGNENIAVNRTHLDFILKMLVWNGCDLLEMRGEELRKHIIENILRRAVENGLIEDADAERRNLTVWMDGAARLAERNPMK